MKELLDFLRKAGRLKLLRRTGWVYKGIDMPESVAEHSYLVCLLALILARKRSRDPQFIGKCLSLAVVHDVAECIVGDITPIHDRVSPEAKEKREREAMTDLAALVEDPEILELWEEYNGGQSEEASLVKDIDKVEMVLQALLYQSEHKAPAAAFDEFFKSARKKVKGAEGQDLLDYLEVERAKL